LRTTSSRVILLLLDAMQLIFMPPDTALSALDGWVQTTLRLPEASAAMLTAPLRTWSMRTSNPYFLNEPFSTAIHNGAFISFCAPWAI
jgi:hypothetical protein